MTLIALPALLEQFRDAGKRPTAETAGELLDQVKVYNPIPLELETACLEMLRREYDAVCAEKELVT